MHQMECRVCAKPFTTATAHSRYCSVSCRVKAWARRHPEQGQRKCKQCGADFVRWRNGNAMLCKGCWKPKEAPRKPARGRQIGSSVLGTVNELVVSAALLERGIAVFRALCPSCKCDLAILDGERLLRVEVTTGYVDGKGGLVGVFHDPSRWDILGLVDMDYKPWFYGKEVERLGLPTRMLSPSTERWAAK